MFGLSLSKILLTILVIVIVWKGFAFVTRIARQRKKALAGRTGSRPATRRRDGTVELVQCRRCGAYFDPAEGCRCGQEAS